MARKKHNYKDSLFVDLFGKCPKAKENIPIIRKCIVLFAYTKFTEYVRMGESEGREGSIGYALDF